jgi:hypothetical protein
MFTMDKIHTNVAKIRAEMKIISRAQQQPSWNTDRKTQEEKLKQICEYTYKNFPFFWRGCLQDEEGTKKQLDSMLNLLEQIQSGKQDISEVEKTLGDQLFETWAVPQLKGDELREYRKKGSK